jgi:hypothetical protein
MSRDGGLCQGIDFWGRHLCRGRAVYYCDRNAVEDEKVVETLEQQHPTNLGSTSPLNIFPSRPTSQTRPENQSIYSVAISPTMTALSERQREDLYAYIFLLLISCL